MLSLQKRFRFWTIFWVVLGFGLLFFSLGLIAIVMTPMEGKLEILGQLFSLHGLLDQFSGVAFFAIYYYITLNLFYQYISGKRSVADYVRPVLLSFVLLAVYQAGSYFFEVNAKLELEVNHQRIKEKLTPGLRIFVYAVSSVFITAFAFLVAYLAYLRDERKQRKVLEEQKMQLEVEKSQANFNFLKAQINPHFLHNTLNFLYAKSLPYSPELSEGILTLSDIMRYALSEGNARDGKAPLRDEIEHMRNVIKINQLRFSNNFNVQFGVEGVVNGAQIIPFVLITLVENAFKHGDLKSPESPIVILLRVEGHRLFFSCRNRKKTGPKELSTGIGLDNIKKRLDLAYGTGYTFVVKEDEQFYTTELTIDPL